jgi:protein-tyrosine-phosphatase
VSEPADTPRRLLFVCVENSCRSQMAEAWARRLGGARVAAHSAGSRPSGVVNPKAVASMAELGEKLGGQRSEGIDEVVARVAKEAACARSGPRVAAAPDRPLFDAVVTMGCGDACPHVPAARHVDWSLPDPKHMPPDQFAQVRDAIGERVRALLEELGVPPPAPA